VDGASFGEEKQTFYGGIIMMLGNYDIGRIQERLGITLSQKEVDFFNSTNQQNANNIENDKWHCFDIPFQIVCGHKNMAIKIRDILSPFADSMKTSIGITWNKE